MEGNDEAVRGRVAITGAGGRLGGALMRSSATAGISVIGWRRPEYDLDDPQAAATLVERDRPSLIIHSAAWTDVDGCAGNPGLAMRRNAAAVRELADACKRQGTALVLVSTNEVFDGERDDGLGYDEDDDPRPRNAYGASKLAGEAAARDWLDDANGLWIIRTAWLYGPPGNDFPAKIVAAADRLPSGTQLPVVADEFGSPTYAEDLAEAILQLAGKTPGGLFHLVNPGAVSRLGWAERVLASQRPDRALRAISRNEFTRASDPPPWGVLDATRAETIGVRLRTWDDALDDYLADSAIVAR